MAGVTLPSNYNLHICNSWLSCRRWWDGQVMSGKESESWLWAEPTVNPQSDRSKLSCWHTWKEEKREEERPVMQENKSLHQQGPGLVQLARTWDSAWKPGLLGADGLHLSEKGNSIISHRLAKMASRALKFSLGRDLQPIPLLPVECQDQQEVPRAWRGVTCQQESPWGAAQRKSSQPKLHWGLDLNASMQMHVVLGIIKRS